MNDLYTHEHHHYQPAAAAAFQDATGTLSRFIQHAWNRQADRRISNEIDQSIR